MGNMWHCIVRKIYHQQEISVLMVGLDAAGKTTTLYKLKLGDIITTIPTIGFNVETINYKNINFNTWDVGGRDKTRPLWRNYFQTGTDVLIFIVDSNDKERIEECKDELWQFLSEDILKDSILLVLANKQDLANAMSTEEVTEKLGLDSIHDRDWHIQGTSATKGDGLYEGLDWLSSTISQKKLKKTIIKRDIPEDSDKGSWWRRLSAYFPL